LSIALVVGGIGLILFLARNVTGPLNRKQLQSIIEDWAEEEGYELQEVLAVHSRNHPFADRFGFGLGKRAGVIKEIEVRDRKGRLRRGWVWIQARSTGRGYSGFLPNSLEVAWETSERMKDDG
jgi:hypothetical protein